MEECVELRSIVMSFNWKKKKKSSKTMELNPKIQVHSLLPILKRQAIKQLTVGTRNLLQL